MNEENLKPWKPGQSGNPAGRPPEAHPNLVRFTKKAVQETFAQLMLLPQEELNRIRDDQQESGIRAAVASVIMRARARGQLSDLDAMIDRIIGKVPQKTELSGAEGQPLERPHFHFHPTEPLQPQKQAEQAPTAPESQGGTQDPNQGKATA